MYLKPFSHDLTPCGSWVAPIALPTPLCWSDIRITGFGQSKDIVPSTVPIPWLGQAMPMTLADHAVSDPGHRG